MSENEKIILPSGVKVCATCSYWDGERQVDETAGLVVVECDGEGECLVQEKVKPALHDTRQEAVCEWEDLGEPPLADETDTEKPA